MDKKIKINHDIPHTMTLAGLTYLGHLARTVPKNGLIVEVGPLFGSSTWVLAKNADPSVRIISVDTWEPASWIDSIEAKFPGCERFGKSAFDYYTRDCPNVTPVQGYSPQIMADWNEPIDLFFDDATHGDPNFSESMGFYLPKVKPGGIACGDDYASGWRDIVNGVNAIASRWHSRPEVVGRVWSVMKPGAGDERTSIYGLVGPYTAYDLAITVRTADGETIECAPEAWAGFPHQNRLISGVKIDWATKRADGLTGCYQVQSDSRKLSHWARFGEWASVDGAIASLRAHLLGEDNPNLILWYQVSSVVVGPKSIYCRNTKAFRDSAWTQLTPAVPDKKSAAPRRLPKSLGISALRCFLTEEMPVFHTNTQSVASAEA